MNLIWALKLLRSDPPEDVHFLSAREGDSSLQNIEPLPPVLRQGLIAISVLAVLSTAATFGLLCFITWRLIFWRRYHKQYLGYNQYIILIYNLLLADLQQSLAFLICTHWVAKNAIQFHSAACFLQGFWLQLGDPGSGLFVLAIALHTFMLVTSGRKLEHRWFVVAVCCLWGFLALLVIIPLASRGSNVFVPSGAWCWINSAFETDRLWTHYLWIFLAEFGTVVLYTIMFFQLRRQVAASAILGTSHVENLKRLRRVVGYMVIYPVAYVVLSLPLAAGRMASVRGSSPSIAYFCLSGAVMTSSGFVDVLMYTLTRKNLLLESEPSRDRSYNHIPSNGHKPNHLATITAIDNGNDYGRKMNPLRSRPGESEFDPVDRHGSTDNIVSKDVELASMGKVYQETTIEITHEPAFLEDASERSIGDLPHNSHEQHSDTSRIWGK